MNLQPVPRGSLADPSGLIVRVRLSCAACGRIAAAETMFADLDGPPYQAYYCSDCAAMIRANPEG